MNRRLPAGKASVEVAARRCHYAARISLRTNLELDDRALRRNDNRRPTCEYHGLKLPEWGALLCRGARTSLSRRTGDARDAALRPIPFGVNDNGDKMPLGDRMRSAFLKPAPPGSDQAADEPQSVEELQAAVKSPTTKERLVGLIAAPFAALIGILISCGADF